MYTTVFQRISCPCVRDVSALYDSKKARDTNLMCFTVSPGRWVILFRGWADSQEHRMRLATVWVLGGTILASCHAEFVQGVSTTPISSVTTKHSTFRAAVDAAQGAHKTTMRIMVPYADVALELSTSPNKRLFSPRATIAVINADGSEEPVALDKALFHVGHVVGEEGSHVHLSVHPSGGLDGVLRRADGTKLVLSAAARYSGVSCPEHHDTVIYNADDLTNETMDKLLGNYRASCPSASGMNRSAIDGYDTPQRAAFEASMTAKAAEQRRRTRRNSGTAPQECNDSMGGRCSCGVALVGDHFFYMGPHAQQNAQYGIQHMINVLVEADAIYRKTDFDGVTGLGFVVHSAVVYPTSAGGNPTPGSNYPDGTTYLNAVTNGLKNRYTDTCTSLVFTHRDFQEGVLGMAWVAEENGYGGICDPVFNCGFNTGINFGQIVTPFIASLVFSHEVGHNWGAQHDPSGSCAPGDDNGGNYIMYAAASDGTHTNNNRFSTCSTASMGTVLSLLREGCFVEAGVGCGDGEVTGDEECDCGDQCTPTSCCTSDCTVNRQLYQCSPQNPIRYPCCTLQCMYAGQGVLCHTGDECAEQAYCLGNNASCPLEPKADDTPCRCQGDDCNAHPGTNPQVCDRGVCHKYVCELYGATQCGLMHPHSCELGCRGSGFGDGTECVSTFDTSKTPSGFGGGRFYVAGTPCRRNLGRCDSGGTCVTIDQADGMRAGAGASRFVAENWMAIVGSVAGVVIAILGVMHWYQHRVIQYKIRESERAYLLAAANAQAEASEERLAYAGGVFEEEPDDEGEVDYAVPSGLGGGSAMPQARHQNYMEVESSM
eukprot:m.160320 g.160320  ORF g.160320 m.160320 type:complete len:827 (+) comp11930_c0_seq1:1761-4241(+)